MCGALSGGVMVIGAMHGRNSLEESDWQALDLATRYRERFAAELGTTRCGPLYERVHAPGGLGSCALVVKRAALILLELLAERRREMNDRRLARLAILMLIGLVCLSINGCAPPERAATFTPERETVAPLPTFTAIPSPAGTLIPTATLTCTPEPTPTEAAKGPRPELVEGLTITIIYDNNEYDERLETAWGFSCFVEGLEKTILFDTGGDSAMPLPNMRKLGIDPQDVEAIVISHIHYDHLGRLPGFLEENKEVTVYLPEYLPESIKDTVRESGAELLEVREPVKICERAYSTGEQGTQIRLAPQDFQGDMRCDSHPFRASALLLCMAVVLATCGVRRFGLD